MKKLIIKILFVFIFIVNSPLALPQNNIVAVTENYPPYNMKDKDQIVGISTDIVKEIFKRAHVQYTLELFPWARAYKMALEQKNTVVFAASRTPERENLFKWVGPIGESNWVFYAKKGTKIKINSLEDAMKYQVGGYNGDATSEYLLKNGFTVGKNIQLSTNENQNALKLEAGRIDLWATGSLLGLWISKSEKSGKIVPLYVIKKSELYAAFNKDTDAAFIKKLNDTLNEMRKENIIEKINKKYR